MKVLGLITEYNPFHNGHLYHLEESKRVTEATHTLAIMSGNFLQRGEPALLNKWIRAKMAVEAGVDLVIELPTLFACASAELFAFGSVSLLNHLGVVDFLCFGSELGKIQQLYKIASILISPPSFFTDGLKIYIDQGMTFPSARAAALLDYLREVENLNGENYVSFEQILKNPNNILGIEYLKALIQVNSSIQPFTILRKKAPYHSRNITSNIASATAIREHLRINIELKGIQKVVPPSTYTIMKKSFDNGLGPVFSSHYENMILSLIRRGNPGDLALFFDVQEGLENRIYQCALATSDFDSFLGCVKSKRYTLTRIQRIAMHILLNLQKSLVHAALKQGGPQYARVLAFNEKGREILKTIKHKSAIPIVTKVNKYVPQNPLAKEMLDLDIRATNLYGLGLQNPSYIKQQLDFSISPYYKKD